MIKNSRKLKQEIRDKIIKVCDTIIFATSIIENPLKLRKDLQEKRIKLNKYIKELKQ